MTDDVRVELGGGALARALLGPLCELYDEVFSAPPFFWRDDESQLHRERLLGLLDDSSFGIAVAQGGGELVGFAYGFSFSRSPWLWCAASFVSTRVDAWAELGG